LLKNFPMQTLRYHASAFAYRLLVGYGAAFWAVAAAALLWPWKRRGAIPLRERNGIAVAAVMMVVGNLITVFRVPAKPEYGLPLLLGAILLFQTGATKAWNYALLISSLAVGAIALSPYDNRRDLYGWRFDTGWYLRNLTQARDNRLQIDEIRTILASSPPRTLLVAVCSWTDEQARKSDAVTISGYRGIDGLRAIAFAGLGADRVAVHYQEPKLRELLDRNRADGPGQRMPVAYEQSVLALLRRWDHLDLAQYGRAVNPASEPFEDLWRHAGQSNAGVVEVTAVR
jgi:hypothetical protein